MPHPVTRIALGLLLLLAMPPVLLGAPAPLPAHYATGDEWLDAHLADIDRYASRHPAAFAAEVERYAGVPRDYVRGLLAQPGWQAGDAWFACFLARALEATCRSVVRARAGAGAQAGWSPAMDGLDTGTRELAQVRLALADSYRRWARPLQPDAALARALREREANTPEPKESPP
ncbi:hypothetical protein B1992_05245 [Pseudoxanthomonas broegbernensis]|uniref:Uncharacterized protein n=2 Tax=Pseudoxanthomonas broegbernensis TaxID=83619 RepID=A0A7V8GNX4_9GAMM|nr:hypothetical protein B1992_05245 [Pseudoxanthomonas broegbernensis]